VLKDLSEEDFDADNRTELHHFIQLQVNRLIKREFGGFAGRRKCLRKQQVAAATVSPGSLFL